jgi:hypothetical protein
MNGPQIFEEHTVRYPECDKFHRVSDDVSTLHEFLEWLASEGLQVCSLKRTGQVGPDGPVEHYFPIREQRDALIQRFFSIDPSKLESERRAMLAALRDQE